MIGWLMASNTGEIHRLRTSSNDRLSCLYDKSHSRHIDALLADLTVFLPFSWPNLDNIVKSEQGLSLNFPA